MLIQKKLTPTQKKRKFLLGDIFLGLDNGNFGDYLPGWKDHGSISAIDVSTGKRVWKFDTPEPERGGVSLTATGVGFAGGGDGVLRAFDSKTGKVLWTFQTGRQIAAGPTIFSAGGKEYVAITVGGSPTSSDGGLASQLQVFALGGSKAESPKPPGLTSASGSALGGERSAGARRGDASLSAHARAAAGRRAHRRSDRRGHARALEPEQLQPRRVKGKVLLGGKPVSGASVSVDRYVAAAERRPPTAASRALVDSTLARRHPIVSRPATMPASAAGRSRRRRAGDAEERLGRDQRRLQARRPEAP